MNSKFGIRREPIFILTLIFFIASLAAVAAGYRLPVRKNNVPSKEKK